MPLVSHGAYLAQGARQRMSLCCCRWGAGRVPPVGVRLRYSIGVGRNILVHLLVEPLRHLWQANGCQCQRCYTDDCCAFHNLRPFFTFSVNNFRSLLFFPEALLFFRLCLRLRYAFVCGFVMPLFAVSLWLCLLFRFLYRLCQRFVSSTVLFKEKQL